MKYFCHINQKAAIDLELPVDAVDLLIHNMLSDFAISGNCHSMNFEGNQYYLFNWKLIPDQLPILGLSSKAGVRKRIRNLEEAGILIAHPDIVKMQRAWYRFGENHSRLLFDNRQTSIDPVHESVQVVHESKQDLLTSESSPVSKSVQDNNTTNNKIKDNYILSPDQVITKKEELLQSEYYIEQVAMLYKVDKSIVKFHLKQFLDEQATCDGLFRSAREIKSHFNNVFKGLKRDNRLTKKNTFDTVKHQQQLFEPEKYPDPELFAVFKGKNLKEYKAELIRCGWRFDEENNLWIHDQFKKTVQL